MIEIPASFRKYGHHLDRVRVMIERCQAYFDRALAFGQRALREKKGALYALPLLIHWVIGITIEVDDRIRRSALRSMILFYLYLIATGVLLLAFDRVASGRDPNYYASIVIYFIQMASTLSYIGFSFRLAFLEWRERPAPNLFIDRFAEDLIAIFNR
jgi:hypothetical protein